MKRKFAFSIRLTTCDATTGLRSGEPWITAQFAAQGDAEACWASNHRVPSPNRNVTRVWELLRDGKTIRSNTVQPREEWGEVVATH